MKYQLLNKRDGEVVQADKLEDLVEYMHEIRLTDEYISIEEK